MGAAVREGDGEPNRSAKIASAWGRDTDPDTIEKEEKAVGPPFFQCLSIYTYLNGYREFVGDALEGNVFNKFVVG